MSIQQMSSFISQTGIILQFLFVGILSQIFRQNLGFPYDWNNKHVWPWLKDLPTFHGFCDENLPQSDPQKIWCCKNCDYFVTIAFTLPFTLTYSLFFSFILFISNALINFIFSPYWLSSQMFWNRNSLSSGIFSCEQKISQSIHKIWLTIVTHEKLKSLHRWVKKVTIVSF